MSLFRVWCLHSGYLSHRAVLVLSPSAHRFTPRSPPRHSCHLHAVPATERSSGGFPKLRRTAPSRFERQEKQFLEETGSGSELEATEGPGSREPGSRGQGAGQVGRRGRLGGAQLWPLNALCPFPFVLNEVRTPFCLPFGRALCTLPPALRCLLPSGCPAGTPVLGAPSSLPAALPESGAWLSSGEDSSCP